MIKQNRIRQQENRQVIIREKSTDAHVANAKEREDHEKLLLKHKSEDMVAKLRNKVAAMSSKQIFQVRKESRDNFAVHFA